MKFVQDNPIHPQIDPSAVICPGAVLIGQVRVGARCFIGPNAVLRGDIEPITMEDESNVQDCVVLHTHKGNPVTIEKGASVGHGAVVHGARIGAGCIIGMNAVVLDRAHVGAFSVVGAGAVVTEGMEIPPRSLVVGMPAKILRSDDARIADMAKRNGERYQVYRTEHLANKWGVVVGPINHPAVK